MKSFAHEISGMPVHASDGEIGTIEDVVIDPQSWSVRHLEVSTGWLFGRDVLIPVDKVIRIDAPDGAVTFDLTKEQIENSPPAEPEESVDPGYESRLMGYYGLASYWTTEAEVVRPQVSPADPGSSEAAAAPSLMFASDIEGYELDAQGEKVGIVRDVLIELDTWKVTSLMADLGGLFTSDSTAIAIARLTGIDRESRIAHVLLSSEDADRSHQTSLDDLPYIFPYVPPIA